MVGWPHPLNGHEFDLAPGVGAGQGSLACCSPWGCKESDTTERLKHIPAAVTVGFWCRLSADVHTFPDPADKPSQGSAF